MFAAVHVQQHPDHRPPRTSSPVHPTLASLRNQARPWQGRLHPRVAQLSAVFLPHLLVKVAYVQIVIAFPVQAQDLLARCERHPLRALTPIIPLLATS